VDKKKLQIIQKKLNLAVDMLRECRYK